LNVFSHIHAGYGTLGKDSRGHLQTFPATAYDTTLGWQAVFGLAARLDGKATGAPFTPELTNLRA
jgi:hypothetical protein